jgi:ribosomal protein S18 acetylase RimI-like enzyme
VGRRLFLDFIEHVQSSRPEISRVELMARDSNPRQIAFYEAIGCRREGTFERRIKNPNGEFESDIPMAWLKDEDMTV